MEFDIIGAYKGQTEILDTVTGYKEAVRVQEEYQLSFGSNWVVWLVEV